MVAVLFFIHIVLCAVLVTVVLMQAGRGGGLSGAFGGGGGGQALFGGRGAATFLNKATVVLGGLFFLTSLSLAILSARGTEARRSLIQEEATRARPAQTAPAQPGGEAGAPVQPVAPGGGAGQAPAPQGQPAPATP